LIIHALNGVEGIGIMITATQTGKTSSPTIYDIARVAGVNASTVSRALSKPERVSVKTRQLIEDAASQLNYQVNPFARALPTGRTNMLGLIVTDIANPTFFDIVLGAQTAATDRDYTVILVQSSESPATEVTVARRLMGTVDGLILASPRMNDDNIRALARDKPVVVINRDVEGLPSVVPDVNKGISEAVRNLAANGHKKVVFVAGPAQSWMSTSRWESVQAACEWSQLEAVRVESTKPTVDGGRLVARDVRGTGASAVLTYNDLLAIGLMQELQAAGLVVPDRISIVGFDDIFGANFTTPPLTTVRSSQEACGGDATTLLLDLLHNGKAEIRPRVETELVVRGSSGRLLHR
jgi:LacI family repressor for deo operon, udp, cdd, tsx, nupC, and nupG